MAIELSKYHITLSLSSCQFFFLAPEFILDNEVTQANDMFALGFLAYAIHNKGVPLLHTFNNLRTYERKIQELNMMDYKNMPPHFQGTSTVI